MTTQHIQSRLETRGLTFTPSQLQDIAKRYTVSTALIVGSRPSEEGRNYGKDAIILIIRDARPVTIMTRRQTQNFYAKNFNVSQVKYL